MIDDKTEALSQAFADLEDPESIQRFLLDLCTPAEISAMAERWCVAKLVNDGIPYRKINEMTGVSTATITRVARCISQGADGYKTLLEKK